VKFGRYRNFGNFGIGQKATDTERGFIPKPIPKDEKFSLKNRPFELNSCPYIDEGFLNQFSRRKKTFSLLKKI
jgi:hypothetical protein